MLWQIKALIKHGHNEGWLWFLGCVSWGVWQIIQGVPDFTSLTWKELAVRALKALPVVLTGTFGRGILFGVGSNPEDRHDAKDAGE